MLHMGCCGDIVWGEGIYWGSAVGGLEWDDVTR